MHKRFVVLLVFVFFSIMVTAQQGDLVVLGTAPDLHLLHTVAPKENWYSVGRMYNLSPKEIAPYNGTTMDKPLSIGQQLKIPLTGANFSQTTGKGEDETLVPVYHTLQEKEWLYRVSTNYNKVPIENLEKWNRIDKDQAKAGMKLIVGYLKTRKDQPPVANNTAVSTSAPPATVPAPVEKAPEKKPEPVAKQEDKPVMINTPPAPAEEKKVAVEEKKPPVEEKKAVVNDPVNPPVTKTSGNISGGYFRAMYEESGKTAAGTAGVFKSISGWQDGKYYALMNKVPTGTIIKVSNPQSNKAIYAKVLSQLPDMKESAGLTIRISDAAAAELGSATATFQVEIKY